MSYFENYGKVLAVSNYGSTLRVNIERFGIYQINLCRQLPAKVGDEVKVSLVDELLSNFKRVNKFTMISLLRTGDGANIYNYRRD